MINKRTKHLFITLVLLVLPIGALSFNVPFDLVYAASPTRYEAEDAVLSNATEKDVSGSGSYAFGVSGTGFVGFNNGTKSTITFTVSVADQGFYPLYIKYAVGSDSSGVKVEYNGLSSVLDFTENNGWGSFNVTSPLETTVRLKKGSNTIVVSRAYDDKYGEIDYIEIGDCTEKDNPPALPSGSNWVKYEAEDATLTNASYKEMFTTGSYARGVSGTGFVGYNGGNVSNIAFTVSVQKDGQYELAVKYAVDGDGSGVKITSNDISQVVLYTSAQGWGSFRTTPVLETKINLKKGDNVVSLSKAYNNKFGEIDYIAIGNLIKETEPSPFPSGTEWNKYEAENGEVVLGTRKNGSGNVRYVGNLDYDASFIDFNLVGLEKGAYEVRVKYATGFTDLNIKVYAGERGRNGRLEYYGEAETFVCDWGNFLNTASFFVSLDKNSFIRVSTKYVEIDYIEVSNRVGDFFHGEADVIKPDTNITDGGFIKLGGE